MRKKTAYFGWYVSIWFDRPKPNLVNWPLAKVLQRHGDAETGFKLESLSPSPFTLNLET
jgi:hypothetical protein